MGLWLFLLLMVLLIPIIMIICGKHFSKSAPKEINYIFGYRTTRSMKNEKTWEFAHKMLGKIWKRCGIALLILAIVGMLLLIDCYEDTVGKFGVIIIYIELAVLLFSLIPIEIELKKKFDDDGNERE